MIFYNGFNLLVDILLVGGTFFATYLTMKAKYFSTKRESFIPPF